MVDSGVYETFKKHSSPWISHNQKWREAKIDSILKYKGISINNLSLQPV
jgi:lambda repressor-like predicted transcriptional regulator